MKPGYLSMVTAMLYGACGYIAPILASWLLNVNTRWDQELNVTFGWVVLTLAILVSVGYPLNKTVLNFLK